MNILAIGDVVSAVGCEFLRSKLPAYKKLKAVDICIANGENSAVGNGITPTSAQYLFDSGVDVITTGNHVFRRREVYDMLDESDSIIRPANFHKSSPGKGFTTVDMGFAKVGIVNLSGMVYMDRCDNPFAVVEEVLPQIEDCRIKIVDFHSEASAEKKAMGFWLDGRVSAVWGTHTHVATADERILPGGTAYVTDIGMTGPSDGVLGVDAEVIIRRFVSAMPQRFTMATGPVASTGILVDIEDGKAKKIQRVSV